MPTHLSPTARMVCLVPLVGPIHRWPMRVAGVGGGIGGVGGGVGGCGVGGWVGGGVGPCGVGGGVGGAGEGGVGGDEQCAI
jgi:hypothetical protein